MLKEVENDNKPPTSSDFFATNTGEDCSCSFWFGAVEFSSQLATFCTPFLPDAIRRAVFAGGAVLPLDKALANAGDPSAAIVAAGWTKIVAETVDDHNRVSMAVDLTPLQHSDTHISRCSNWGILNPPAPLKMYATNTYINKQGNTALGFANCRK